MNKILSALAICVVLNACSNNDNNNSQQSNNVKDTITVKDLHTQSNADSVVVKHLDLDIKVDFEKKQITGCATWDIENPNKQDVLKLDTRPIRTRYP